MAMSKSQLAIVLSKLKVFAVPDAKLEQYPTESEIAAAMLWKCYMDDNLDGKTLADFGAGTGILGLGAALLGAEKVYMVDIDKGALGIAKENQSVLESQYGKLPIVYVNSQLSKFNQRVDTVIQNPPFGVQDEHADRIFLEKAMELADNVYTLHKIESKRFIEAVAKDNSFEVKGLIEYEFPLKHSMKFHSKSVKKIRVGCWILSRKSENI